MAQNVICLRVVYGYPQKECEFPVERKDPKATAENLAKGCWITEGGELSEYIPPSAIHRVRLIVG